MEILNETLNEQSCAADGTRCYMCVAANVFHYFLIAYGDESIQLIGYLTGCHSCLCVDLVVYLQPQTNIQWEACLFSNQRMEGLFTIQ